ncbi:MAG: serine/threonine protein kinase, partial [Bifidobacteriaceae bacterium]|nr:serine/threonine protein kinase [Bifidobacteriaceae bacterium]
MSTKRRPAEPPMIDGYEFKRLLGQGGFADVFVYQQRTPHREVAVKVLLREMLGTDAVTRLNAEADAMAGLSQHPNIVTIFGAGVAADGRPYIVMDYYRRPSLAEELKGPRRSVASGLAIGVQLAGALESAHRLNIVHRDIKPANILVDSVGRPVLGDFGIALNVADPSKSAEGMSVPWSPPEAFAAEPWADRQSDVWALAATIYTLLAGRAPFVEPNGDNRIHAHADRIQHAPLRPLGRADVPASLDQVLGTAMAKEPRARYQTALQLGQQLRAVQQELQLAPTPLEVTDYSVADGHPKDDDDEAAQGTRLRPITVIDAYGGAFGAAPGAGTGPAAGSGVPPNPATGTNVPPNPATAPGVPPNLATGTGWASAAPGTGGGGAADPAGAAGAGTATNWDGGAGPTGLSGTWTAQWSWPAPAGRGLTTAPGA